jgi:site-specific DNA-methyltransferase (adenine-specific)
MDVSLLENEKEKIPSRYYIRKYNGVKGPRYSIVELARKGDRYKYKKSISYGNERPQFFEPSLVRDSCENYLKSIHPGSVDLIIDDPPYGITKLQWDDAPDWDILANLYYRALNDNGLVYVFGKQPTLIDVYNSFIHFFDFRFEVIWNRNNVPWSSNFKPLPIHENIFVFCKKGTKADATKFYTKQIMTTGKPYSRKRKKNHPATQEAFNKEQPFLVKNVVKRYPKSILEIPPIISNSKYPTQKPVDLIRWIILASSKPSDTVLDPHVGSGTTLVSAFNLCRKSIGIERDEKAYDIANRRVQEELNKYPKKYLKFCVLQ